MNLRSSKEENPRYWILDKIPSIDDRTITGCRLPTARQVLYCFLAFHQIRLNVNEESRTVSEVCKAVVHQVEPFYQRAGIPTLTRYRMEK